MFFFLLFFLPSEAFDPFLCCLTFYLVVLIFAGFLVLFFIVAVFIFLFVVVIVLLSVFYVLFRYDAHVFFDFFFSVESAWPLEILALV